MYALNAASPPYGSMRHIYQFCDCTKALWTAVGPLGDLSLSQMIAPLPVDLEQARKVVRLVRIIKHEFVRRRLRPEHEVHLQPIRPQDVLYRRPILT
ncbi:CIC11C00000003185 [Sungouiella intermedia]|uniref:CIC11C00000003185 n=1 Tax=Sungouiella intermedia TaxID=45354 RepID=A0A1L0DG44_9ASCO|nr:CIC11C00000003185 [[Candida] intermedia]